MDAHLVLRDDRPEITIDGDLSSDGRARSGGFLIVKYLADVFLLLGLLETFE